MLPPIVTAVPVVVNVNGATLKGEKLFDKVFGQIEADPYSIMNDFGMKAPSLVNNTPWDSVLTALATG